MGTFSRGLVSGLVATAALALVILLRRELGILPELNIVPLISSAAGELFGVPRTALAGWVLLFVIGGVWGLVFGWIYGRITGRSGLVRGLIFAVAVWGIMMVVFMPVAGAGWFGLSVSAWAPVVALVMHLIFGAVMGVCFERLPKRSAAQEMP